MEKSLLNINKIYLMLGERCNFKCKYCCQNFDHQKQEETVELTKNIIDYLNELLKFRLENNKKEKIVICFWGGEPLLYFNIIQDFISIFRNKFNYSMVSNGSLLTQQTVDFINKHNIHFTLSCDGFRTNITRKINILEDPFLREFINKIKPELLSINGVISAYNDDIQAFIRYSDNTRGQGINLEKLIHSWEMPKDIYNYNYNIFESTVRKAFDIIYEELKNPKREMSKELRLFRNEIISVIRRIQNIKNNKTDFINFYNCGQMKSVLNLDLNGNIYACHNYSDILGTIKDNYDELVKKYIEKFRVLKVKCKDCSYLLYCNGGCPYSTYEADDTTCKIRIIIYDAISDLINKLTKEKINLGTFINE